MTSVPATGKQKPQSFANQLLVLCVAGMWLWVGAMWLSWLHPALELARHSALHGLAAAGLLGTVSFFSKHRTLLAWLIPPTVYLLLLTQPWSWWSLSKVAIEKTDLTVLCWNILSTNRDISGIDRTLREARADIVVLIEVRPDLMNQFPWLADEYPHQKALTSWGGRGIAVLSKLPQTELSIIDFAKQSAPAIVARLHSAQSGNELDLVGFHTISPMPPGRAIQRDLQIDALIDWSRGVRNPVCVIGDLNTTPWTASFQRLIAAGYRDSRVGVGNQASWPARCGPFGIPIDHALALGSCEITDRMVGKACGSDHRPLTIRLRF